MTVNLKLFLILFFFTFLQNAAIIKRVKQNKLDKDRILRLLPKKIKRQIKRKLKYCEDDEECIKYTLKDALKKIKNNPTRNRKLRQDSNNIMSLVIVMILIYLMFTQPLMAGVILFLGGLSGFGSFLRRERRLNKINNEIVQTVENFSKGKVRKMYQSERKKLFHYFYNNPVKFRKINKQRLVNLTVDYYDQVYNKHNDKLNDKINRFARSIFKNQNFIKKKFSSVKEF